MVLCRETANDFHLQVALFLIPPCCLLLPLLSLMQVDHDGDGGEDDVDDDDDDHGDGYGYDREVKV